MMNKTQTDAVILNAMVIGTVEAVGKEMALLAMLSNGIHLAIAYPELAKRLARLSEIIVRGKPLDEGQLELLAFSTLNIDELSE